MSSVKLQIISVKSCSHDHIPDHICIFEQSIVLTVEASNYCFESMQFCVNFIIRGSDFCFRRRRHLSFNII